VWHHYVPFSARSAVAFKLVGIVASPPVPIDKLEGATIKYDRGRVMFEGSAGDAYSPSPTHDMIYDFITDWEDSWPTTKLTTIERFFFSAGFHEISAPKSHVLYQWYVKSL
jgi:hypothetical protein